MTVKETLTDLRLQLNHGVEGLINAIAKVWGYPENPGMPIVQESVIAERSYYAGLPTHLPYGWPPRSEPKNLLEALIGTVPHVQPVERIIYESPEDGYYNFYIQNYKNLYFLPDWLSEFLQVQFNLCLDITVLEMARDAAFLVVFIYVQLLTIRLALYWYLTINPYTRPWVYFIAMTDWIQDTLAGFSPVILGVDIMPSLIIGLTGKIADSLNHLVFTMPFLPSEGQRAKILINGELKDILVFRYLPYLWYKHPIPEDLREFWFTERPDILKFLQKRYPNLGIDFYPNRVLKEIYEYHILKKIPNNMVTENTDILKDTLSNLPSETIASINHYSTALVHWSDSLFNDLIIHTDKFT